MWGHPRGLCVAHGTDGRGPEVDPSERVRRRTAPLCDCAAYAWPHRPGGGLCRWPDPPRRRSTVPEGTRAAWRRGNGGRWFALEGYPVEVRSIPPDVLREEARRAGGDASSPVNPCRGAENDKVC
jgi:hypothetical protein